MTVGMRAFGAALLLSGAGCTAVRTVGDPSRFIAETHPKVIYVLHNSGAVVDVEQPQMRGDSLVGNRYGLSRSVAIPMSQIQRIVAVQPDKTRTILAITGITAASAALGYLIIIGEQSGPNCNSTSRYQTDTGCR